MLGLIPFCCCCLFVVVVFFVVFFFVVVVFFVCFFFFFGGGGGVLPEKGTKLAGARIQSCCFVHIKLDSKVKGLGFRDFNLYQGSGCCQL